MTLTLSSHCQQSNFFHLILRNNFSIAYVTITDCARSLQSRSQGSSYCSREREVTFLSEWARGRLYIVILIVCSDSFFYYPTALRTAKYAYFTIWKLSTRAMYQTSIIRRREQQSSKEDDIVFVGMSCHSCFLHLNVQVGKWKCFRSTKAKYREYYLTRFSEHSNNFISTGKTLYEPSGDISCII